MMQSKSYRNAFIAALILHFSIACMLLIDTSSERPVLTPETKTEASAQPLSIEPQEQPIKAVSVDSQEVMKTVNHLKEEKIRQQKAEESRQKALQQQAEAARKERIAEQQRLEKLKNEAAKLAIARKKQMEEEQQRLKELAQEKKEQEKHIADMKKQQLALQEEAKKLAELKKKKADELAKAEQVKQSKAKEEQLKKQQAAAAQQAALNAEKNARIAGEVDKYKALIISAISRQWILPENVSGGMSSQFRIRLAPDGAVLDVSLTRSSGDPILDRSAQSAIFKASPLPVPSDPETFNVFRDISLTVRPENARG
jgi:colicin import membrane protein